MAILGYAVGSFRIYHTPLRIWRHTLGLLSVEAGEPVVPRSGSLVRDRFSKPLDGAECRWLHHSWLTGLNRLSLLPLQDGIFCVISRRSLHL